MPLPDELKQLAKRVSNWGRWGAADQRGTLNFITPEAVQRGAAAVRRGPRSRCRSRTTRTARRRERSRAGSTRSAR